MDPQEKVNTINSDDLSNIDAEIALIGCILRENKYFEKISDFLLPEHFTNPLNTKLFSIISKLISQNQLVSPITLKNYFSSSKEDYNIEVFDYLKQIKDSAPSMINAYNYGRIIYDLHLKRSLVSLGNEIKNNALIKETEKDGNMQIEEAEENLFKLSEKGSLERKYFTLGEALKDDFFYYMMQVKKNANHLANGLSNLGYDIVSGGTDNHCL